MAEALVIGQAWTRLLDEMDEAVLMLDASDRLLWANRAAQQLCMDRPVPEDGTLPLWLEPSREELLCPNGRRVRLTRLPAPPMQGVAWMLLLRPLAPPVPPAFFSAGLAHDLGNLLAAALVNIEVAQHASSDPQRLERAAQACLQAAALARRLAVGATPASQQGLAMHELLADAVGLLEHRFKAPWSLTLRLHAPFDQVLGERPILLGALVNLLLNACEAMPTGGPVTVETGGLDLDGAPGLWVAIRDAGPGMPSQVRDGLAGLKASGKGQPGHGLGLAMVAQAAGSHGGKLEVEAAGGQGSQVRLLLPLLPESR